MRWVCIDQQVNVLWMCADFAMMNKQTIEIQLYLELHALKFAAGQLSIK